MGIAGTISTSGSCVRKRVLTDLSVVWQMLERHKEQMEEKEDVRINISTTWELVVVQVGSDFKYQVDTPPRPEIIKCHIDIELHIWNIEMQFY